MSNRRASTSPPCPRDDHHNGTGAGILTGCPSPTLCSLGLGPPNPTRIARASEPLGFRWDAYSASFTLLMPAFALPHPPRRLPPALRRCGERSPTIVPHRRSAGG